MYFKNKFYLTGLIGVAFLAIAGCNSQSTKKEEPAVADEQDSTSEQIAKVKKVFYTVPSPVQATALLKKSGAKYAREILNATANVSRYTTNYDKAMNLGVYGTDLAYTNIFNQTQEAINYLAVVNKLAGGLGMSNMIENLDISKRFQANINNRDSLVDIISDIFRESDDYLKENQQYHSAALVLVGGWIEGLYIAIKQSKKNPSKEISDRIAEQKYSLRNLLSLIDEYKNEKDFAELITSLTDLKQTYDGIVTDRTEKAPSIDTAGKVTTINTTSKISITDDQMKEITSKIEALRNKIIK